MSPSLFRVRARVYLRARRLLSVEIGGKPREAESIECARASAWEIDGRAKPAIRKFSHLEEIRRERKRDQEGEKERIRKKERTIRKKDGKELPRFIAKARYRRTTPPLLDVVVHEEDA